MTVSCRFFSRKHVPQGNAENQHFGGWGERNVSVASQYVQVGSSPGAVISWSDTQIIAAVAIGSTTGVVQVFQGGVNSSSLPFTVNTTTVVAVTPNSGAAGTQVAITGSGFGSTQGSGMVWLGTAQGVVTSWSDTEVDATVAPGSFSGNAQVLQNGVWSNSVPFSVPGNPRISKISPASGPVGTTVTISGVGFGASQGSGIVWIGGAYASAVAWSDTQVQATVAGSAVTGIAKIQQNGNWSNAIAFTVSGSSTPVTLVPDALNMVVGETRSIQAIDSNSQPVTGLAWSSSDPTIVSLSTDDPPIITALAAGNVTINAGNASADLTVTSGSLPLGTIIWSNPGDVSGVQQIVPAVPSPTGVADVFALQNDCNVQAVASDGTLAWTRNIGAPGSGYGCKSVVPDFQGGFLAVDSGNQAYLSSPGSVQKLDGITGQPYPAYSIANFRTTPRHEPVLPVVHTDGTIFAVDGDSVVAIDPTTGLPKFSATMEHSTSVQSGCGTSNSDTLPTIGSNLIIAGDGYAYAVYSYTVQSVQQVVCGQGNNYTEHDEIHVRLLRVGSGGDSSKIVLADSSQDITVSPLTHGTQITQVGANPAYNEFLQPIITNQNQGVLVALTHDDPTYCASTTITNNSPTTYGGCTSGTGSYYTLITTSGSSIVSQTAVPGSIDYIIPILQAQDGTYYGVIDHTGINTDFLGKFDQNGNVQWSVPNYYAVIATADDGVIAQTDYPYNTDPPTSVPYYSSAVSFDQNGNQTGQIASVPEYSWKSAYQLGPVNSLVAPSPAFATSYTAAVAGNVSGNGNGSVQHSIGLAWCGTGFAKTRSCMDAPYNVGGPDMTFAYVANPSSTTIGAAQDFTSAYPQWVGTIISNAMRALQQAFAKFPIRVELASSHPSGWLSPSPTADQDHIVGVVGGWPSQNATGQLITLSTSAVYYWPILMNAQIAVGYPQGQGPDCGQDWCTLQPTYPPQTASDIPTFQKIMAAVGTGIGNSAAHELGHQFQDGTPNLRFMDCGSGGVGPCENSNNFVFEFFSGSGFPQDPSNSSSNGAQFKYVMIPGVPPINWGTTDKCALLRQLLGDPNASCNQ